MTCPSYVVITPARDEEEHIGRTIECMARQTVLPKQWIIVNDGSKDQTGTVAKQFGDAYPWIRVLNRPDRGYRAAGSGVMEAFYSGYEAIDVDNWDFIVKFDADLTFDSCYFERSIAKFEDDASLGIGGGVIYNRTASGLELEKHPKFHVRGATKIYRLGCWNDIGGLIREPGWDTLDEVKANMMGWKTESFDEPHLVQERFTGDAAGQWSNRVKN